MVSIVMPAYNESEIIETNVRQWHDAVTAKIPRAEIIIVDDCSSDDTYAILSKLSSELPELRVIRSAVNQGHGPSVLKGLRRANNEYVFQTDSDNQFPVAEFWELWKEREKNDFVVGIRTTRIDSAFRRIVSASVRALILLLWGIWIRDANCAFKLMKHEPLLKILEAIPDDSIIPMISVSILAHKMKFKIKEIPVTHLLRPGGSPSLAGISKWQPLVVRCIKELFKLRLKQ